jgi:hypothetical protein
MAWHGQARTQRAVGLVVVALLTSSCSQKPALYPVRGQVFFAGQPAAGAQVVFHPVAGRAAAEAAARPILPTGDVQADGSFTLKTHPLGDGAPDGEYSVVIVWLEREKTTGEGVVPNKLPGRYASPEKSRLNATVNAAPTELPPFQLTK